MDNKTLTELLKIRQGEDSFSVNSSSVTSMSNERMYITLLDKSFTITANHGFLNFDIVGELNAEYISDCIDLVDKLLLDVVKLMDKHNLKEKDIEDEPNELSINDIPSDIFNVSLDV